MTNLTKKELLATAKEMNIVGRHEMSRDELSAAIEANRKSVQAIDASDEMFSNYVPTLPWRGRPYTFVSKNEEVYNTLPPQAKKIFDYMEETGIIARGDQIVEAAVEAGKLKTTQDHATLFAFYARKLETAGIRLAE